MKWIASLMNSNRLSFETGVPFMLVAEAAMNNNWCRSVYNNQRERHSIIALYPYPALNMSNVTVFPDTHSYYHSALLLQLS